MASLAASNAGCYGMRWAYAGNISRGLLPLTWWDSARARIVQNNHHCELEKAWHCRLVECIALCHIPVSAADKAALLAVADENLCHPAASIQAAAAAALSAMARSYLRGISTVMHIRTLYSQAN